MAAIQRQYIVNGNQRLNVDGADESGGAYTDILVDELVVVDSITGPGSIDVDGAIEGASLTTVTGLFTGAVTSLTGFQTTATARTATADGLTTGLIADGTGFVTVTSADANHIITLPTPTPGARVVLRNAGTGYELRSSAPTTVAINGGSGASAESAIGANVLVTCVCGTATTWVCMNQSTNGTVSATEAAA